MSHRFKHPLFWMTAVFMILLLPLSAWAANSPKTVVAKVQKSDASFPAGADITIVATDANNETATYSNGTDPKGIISYDPSNGGITFVMGTFAVQWKEGDTFSVDIQVGSPGDPGFEFGSTSTTLTADAFQAFSTDGNLDIQLQASQRNMTVTAGNNQTGIVDSALSTAIEITVIDDYGNAVSGVTPTASGDGTLSFTATGSEGKTTGSWTLGTTAGAQTITVSLNGYPNAVVSATATASAATTLTVTGITDPVTAGTASDVVVTAYDAHGNIATGYTGTVTFTSTDAQGVLPANYTFLPGDNGTKTFATGITLKTADEQTVTATDTVTASITGTQSAITVNAAAAATLTVTGITDPITAGTASDVIVTAYDAYSNVATGYTGTVTFTTTDGQAVLPADYTFVGGDSGMKTISGVVLKTAGEQTVTATDTVTGTITATQSAITVNPAAAATLTVTGITDPVTAGTASDVVVTAYDEFGNIATGYTGTVAFTSIDGEAVLPDNYTFVEADNGTKTFSGTLTLKTVGEQTVTATDTVTGTITGTQSAVTVNPAAAATLTVTGITDPVTAGTASDVVVTAYDEFGNIATGYTGIIAFTSSDTNAVLPGNYTFTGGDSGTKTFAAAVTMKTSGEQTVTATDISVGTVTGTQSDITVNSAAAAKLSLEATRTTLASDQKGNAILTAQLLDAYDNTVASEGVAITLTVSDSTYVALDKTALTTNAAGAATATITTLAGTIANPPQTTMVTADSGALTQSSVTFTLVNFSIQVEAPLAPYYDSATGVHLVTSGSTPYTATFSGAGGTSGNYRWVLSGVGTINGGTTSSADEVGYSAPASIAPGEGENFKKDTLTLTDVNEPDTLNDAIDIYIYKPLAVTWPTEAIGIAIGDTTQGVTVAGGTGTYKFQSDDTLVATVDADTGAITPVAVGFCHIQVRDASYGTFAAGEGFDAESLQIEIVDPITVTPATTSLDASGSQTFAASGGKEADGYTWTCSNSDAGTIDATTGLFTAAAVTAPQAATITATDQYGIVGTATVTVYPGMVITETPAGYVDGTPSTYPLLKLGETTTLSAADTSRTYDWTITDWNDAQIGLTVTAASLTVDPDALFAASGAGIYTVTLVDQNNPGLAPTTLKVRVPMKFVAAKFAGVAVKDAGSYYDNQVTDTYTVTGGPVSTVYNYSALDLNGVEVTQAACGVFTDLIATDADNVFNFTAGIDVMASFRVKVTLDKDQYDTDPDVKRLVDAELDELWSGIFRVIPQLTYTGKLVDSEDVPIAGAVVTCTSDAAKTATTDALGEFTITGLAKTGVVYKFFIWKDGYINKIVTGDEIEAGNIILEALAAGSGNIDGTVTLTGDPVPYASGTVAIQAKTAAGGYIKDSDGNIITVLADPSDGSYRLPVPDEHAATGPYTVEFKRTGYIFNEDAGLGVLTNIALNDANADISLNPVTIVTVTGIPEDSDADLENDQVLVKITAEAGLVPFKFDGTATEISVLDDSGAAVVLDVFAAEGANTWSFTHSGYENFTITINADVSDDRDVDTDYKATTTWTYVKSATAPTPTVIADPNVDGGTASSATGDTDVNLPPGGLTGDILSNVTLTIVEADASDAGAATITGSEIIEVVMTGESGEEVDNTDIQRIEITMTFDPTVVTSGTLEAGTYVIYQANTLADLVAGNATAVPASQIILPIDYVNGYVTFWVNHLSAFGVGGAASSSGSGLTSDSSSNCFIATAAFGSPFEKHVSLLRKFRDVYLLPTKLGNAFVQTYYKYSPPAADFIADHDSLRAVVRVALLPAVGISYMMLHTGLIGTLAVCAAVLALLTFGGVAIRRKRMN